MELQERDKNKVRIFIIGGALVCFAYVAYMISTNAVLEFDTVIREWAYGLRTPFLNKILICITYMGNWQSVVGVGLLLLILPGTRKNIGVPFAITSASSTVIYKVAKSIFARPRPDEAVRIISESGFSFPSGHSMNCMVCYGILIYLIRRYCKNQRLARALTILLSLLIAAIGLSRIYVGVHYPTDVIGGWSLGIAVLTGAIILIEKIRR